MALDDILKSKQLWDYKHLELLARSVVKGFSATGTVSFSKGDSTTFSGHRPYLPEDSIASIDWRLSAKKGRPFVKEYQEDVDIDAYILLDTSHSMAYKSGEYSKIDYGRFIASVFSYLLLEHKHQVGFVSYDSKLNNFLPTGGTFKQLKLINRYLTELRPANGTHLFGSLGTLEKLIKRRSLIIIISDFFDELDELKRALMYYHRKGHDVLLYHVLDRDELTFPFTEVTHFESLENGSESIVIEAALFKEAYQDRLKAYLLSLRKICDTLKIDYAQIFTDEPFDKNIASYLMRRGHR